MAITQRQIEAFREVFINRSFTVAGQKMFTSQPAVSRLVRDLEAEIGFQLFSRQGTQIFPTREANTFYQDVHRSFVGLTEIIESAREIERERKSKFSIAVTLAASLTVLPEITSKFHRRWPNTKLEAYADLSPNIINAVALEKYELGLALGPVKNPALKEIELPNINVMCVLPFDHRLATKSVVSINDIRSEPLVLYAGESRFVRRINDIILGDDCNVDVVARAPYASTLCAMVSKGLGIAVIDPLTARFFTRLGLHAKPTEVRVPYEVSIVLPNAGAESRERTFILDTIIEFFVLAAENAGKIK